MDTARTSHKSKHQAVSCCCFDSYTLLFVTLFFSPALLRFQHNLKCVVGRRSLDVLTGGFCFRLRIGGDRELSLLGHDKVTAIFPPFLFVSTFKIHACFPEMKFYQVLAENC